jgi:hypothetical protein
MKKRILSKFVLELPETLESGIAKIVCPKPYKIERVQYEDCVIWWGYNTCWKLIADNWFRLEGVKYIKCEEPEYEKIYISKYFGKLHKI